MEGLRELLQRATQRTQANLPDQDPMEEILMMRRDGAAQRQMQPQHERIMGAVPDAPVKMEDNVIQYFRQMGIPDEVIFRELGIGASR